MFKTAYLMFCAGLWILLVVADTRGWLLLEVNRGGLGRSYRSFGHK